jgi:hypothetical protein
VLTPAALNHAFRSGSAPSQPLEGTYPGTLVTTTTGRLSDPLLRAVARAWMPWIGKRFHPADQTGDNLLVRSARVPARVLWPSYRLDDAGDGRYAAFRFRTYTSPGKLDPDIETLKIDYDSDDNPGFLIRNILDELVEVAPGDYLGKVLLRRRPGADWHLVGYFSLRSH